MPRILSRPTRLLGRLGVLIAILLAPLPATAQGGVHVVAPGDTLTAIAVRYGTTVAELRERNALAGDLLRVGQRLELPGPPGWRFEQAPSDADWSSLGEAWSLPADLLRASNPGIVAPAGRRIRVPPDVGRLATPELGEDLVAFAARHGVAPSAVVDRNGLASPYGIEPGVPLLLPVDAIVPASDPDAPSPDPKLQTSPESTRESLGHAALRETAFDLLGTALVGLRLEPPDDGFGWPLVGAPRITSRFGWRAISVAGNRYHLGLDLGASTGTPVIAARDGVVARTGWVGAYGYAIYVRHADGFETRYAHLSVIDVFVGEPVQRGQRVGRVGSTGASTGPHLHLEVRHDGRALDPLEVLPRAANAPSQPN